MNNYKIKLVIFIILVIILSIIMFYSVFGFNISILNLDMIKKSRTLKEDLISELKINGIDTAYDKNNNIYYYNVDSKEEHKNYILKLDLKDGLKYKILNNNFNVIKVDYDRVYEIVVYNKDFYSKINLKLTNLPIVNIETNSTISANDTVSKFEYINSSLLNKVSNFSTKIHIRGATSRTLDKKSYKVDIYDDNYMSDKKVNFSDFYYGSSFILDALYKDPSKIRNLLSTEIWNEVSSDFTDFNIYSEFVEVFINNEYKGLYVLTEPVNRSNLNLIKETKSNSAVIKMSECLPIKDKEDISKISIGNYMGCEMKYPNDESKYNDTWKNFFNRTYDYYDKDVKNTDDVIKSTYNLKNYIDLVIFNSFINNMDCKLIKNMYVYTNDIYEDELYIQPWDMELTYGLYFNLNSKTLSNTRLDTSSNIEVELKEPYADETNKLIVNRYKELRKTVLTKENFDSYLDSYKSLLTKGATKRDSNVWYEYDVENEIENIRTWLYERLVYFDEYVREIENGI